MSDVFFVLYIAMTPPGGAPVYVYGGVLATPELCQMAGDGIEAAVEASVPDIDITFACRAEKVGVAA